MAKEYRGTCGVQVVPLVVVPLGLQNLVGLSVLSVLNTAAGVMNTYCRHTPSELLEQLGDGILSNVSFQKTEEINKFIACDFCSSVSAMLPSPKSSLPMQFFDQFCIYVLYFFHYVFSLLSFRC